MQDKEGLAIKAHVKSVDLIDHEDWAFWPEDPEDFWLAAEAMIGRADGEAADNFSFAVCSPKALARAYASQGAFVRAVLVLPEYDEAKIKEMVTDLASRASGETWQDIARKLSRHLAWEFDDYHQY